VEEAESYYDASPRRSGPGVEYELGRIREHNLEGQTLLVHRGDIAPHVAQPGRYAAVIDIARFLKPARGKRGPGKLRRSSRSLLRSLAENATTRTPASERLLTMPCEVVDTDPSGTFGQAESETDYLVTEVNADAFVSYVTNVPEALLQWNAVSQNMRLRGIQPDRETYDALYRSLMMAFFSAACLGFTSSIALTLGLLAKVTSIAKFDQAENRKRLEQYDRLLDIAERFDKLTEQHASIEKIRAFRESIHEDPYM
jgi:hypothetical protein